MNEEYEALMRFYILTTSVKFDTNKTPYAAVDNNGALWCYSTRPIIDITNNEIWVSVSRTASSRGGMVCILPTCEFWKETVIEL